MAVRKRAPGRPARSGQPAQSGRPVQAGRSTKPGRRGTDERSASAAGQRVLDAAERLFAAHGYNGVSIRDIAAAAKANISSVYYHYGSKRALLEAVCRRRMAPVVAARAAAMPRDGATPDRLIAAFVGPTLEAAHGAAPEARIFRQLAGHFATDPTPEVRAAVQGIYGDSVRDFVDALRKAYPDAPQDAFFWAVVAAMGAAIYVQSDFAHLARLLGGSRAAGTTEDAIAHVTRFVLGGLDAVAKAGR